jgi:hypothetical protein
MTSSPSRSQISVKVVEGVEGLVLNPILPGETDTLQGGGEVTPLLVRKLASHG